MTGRVVRLLFISVTRPLSSVAHLLSLTHCPGYSLSVTHLYILCVVHTLLLSPVCCSFSQFAVTHFLLSLYSSCFC